MADLVKALEADLFGSYEWSFDQYEELVRVPDASAKTVIYRGLLRALTAFEHARSETQSSEHESGASAMSADDAAAGVAEADAALAPDERDALASVEHAREA
ncbi:MAG: hypothetical protein ACYDCK_10350, partial [Thermoplasmatota archaeon]